MQLALPKQRLRALQVMRRVARLVQLRVLRLAKRQVALQVMLPARPPVAPLALQKPQSKVLPAKPPVVLLATPQQRHRVVRSNLGHLNIENAGLTPAFLFVCFRSIENLAANNARDCISVPLAAENRQNRLPKCET